MGFLSFRQSGGSRYAELQPSSALFVHVQRKGYIRSLAHPMISQAVQEDLSSIAEPPMRADEALEPSLRRAKRVCGDPLPRARPRDKVAVEGPSGR